MAELMQRIRAWLTRKRMPPHERARAAYIQSGGTIT